MAARELRHRLNDVDVQAEHRVDQELGGAAAQIADDALGFRDEHVAGDAVVPLESFRGDGLRRGDDPVERSMTSSSCSRERSSTSASKRRSPRRLAHIGELAMATSQKREERSASCSFTEPPGRPPETLGAKQERSAGKRWGAEAPIHRHSGGGTLSFNGESDVPVCCGSARVDPRQGASPGVPDRDEEEM